MQLPSDVDLDHDAPDTILDFGKKQPLILDGGGTVLGAVELDEPGATNERVSVKVGGAHRAHVVRGRFVGIEDRIRGTRFLGRVVAGPFFPDGPDGDVRVRVEVEGELKGRTTSDTPDRPTPGSVVRGLGADKVGELLGSTGDMRLGTLAGWDAVPIGLQSK